MKVLIVDDSKEMRRVIRLVVKEVADEIHECSDGADALAAYNDHLPDWVLMDIRMKKTDGLAATRQIKASFPEARIVIVTVCRGEDIREAARVAGACGFVVKDNLLELRKILTERNTVRNSQLVASC